MSVMAINTQGGTPAAPADPPPVRPLQPHKWWVVPTVTFVVGVITSGTLVYVANKKADDAQLSAPLKVSISQPADPSGTITGSDDYRGSVENLKQGQVVWLFNRQDTHVNDPNAKPSNTYAMVGPCPVANGQWTCPGEGVGDSNDPVAAAGTYKVWAVVATERDAFEYVTALRAHNGDLGNTKDPRSVEDAIAAITVVRR